MMYWLSIAAFLVGSLAAGDALTCSACMETTSSSESYALPENPGTPTCDSPQPTLCEEGVTLCNTANIHFHYTTESSETVTFEYTRRGCMDSGEDAPPIAPNTCVPDDVFNAMAQASMGMIQGMMSPESGLTFQSLDGSYCTCDSDNCTPSPPASSDGGDAGGDAGGEAQPTEDEVGAEPQGGAEMTMETTTKGAAAATAVGSMVFIVGSILSVLTSYII